MTLYLSIWSFTFIIPFQDDFRLIPDCMDPRFCSHPLFMPGKGSALLLFVRTPSFLNENRRPYRWHSDRSQPWSKSYLPIGPSLHFQRLLCVSFLLVSLYYNIFFSLSTVFWKFICFFIIICHAVSSVSECCVTALSIKCSASVWIAGVLHRKIFGCFWGRTFRYRASLLHVSNLEPVRIRLKKSSCFSIMKLWHG